jgi:uncharacterized membrane protein HdeD (DUF308 family)
MSIDVNRLFLLFMGIVGAAVGLILVLFPQSRDLRLPPYFWVLIAMAAFELVAFARARGAAGTVVTMEARIAGFVVAIVLMIAIPAAFGLPVSLF